MKIFNQSTFDIWPIEDNSVQSIITSPPYWGLRKYDIPDIKICDWEGQYGNELDLEQYLQHTYLWINLAACRVLKDDGLLILNIGDTWAGSGRGYGSVNKGYIKNEVYPTKVNYKRKTKLLIPHRIALFLIETGWILRNDIIWHKTNAMPESVKDRFSKRYENIFIFAKTENYYFDLDAVREKFIYPDIKYNKKTDNHKMSKIDNRILKSLHDGRERIGDPKKGKNPGDVWSIANQPNKLNHYAMFPESLIRKLILCSSRPGDVILDPFCGSGTTLKVAEELNRTGYGIDIGYEKERKQRLKHIQKEIVL